MRLVTWRHIFLMIFLSDNTNCPNSSGSLEDNNHFLLIWSKNCLWRPCMLMDRDKMSNLYRGPSIDASYQVSVHFAKGFQRRRLKCEKLWGYLQCSENGQVVTIASPSSWLEPYGLWLGLRVLCPVKFQRLMASVGL